MGSSWRCCYYPLGLVSYHNHIPLLRFCLTTPLTRYQVMSLTRANEKRTKDVSNKKRNKGDGNAMVFKSSFSFKRDICMPVCFLLSYVFLWGEFFRPVQLLFLSYYFSFLFYLAIFLMLTIWSIIWHILFCIQPS